MIIKEQQKHEVEDKVQNPKKVCITNQYGKYLEGNTNLEEVFRIHRKQRKVVTKN